MKILMIVHGFAPECSGGTESHVLRTSQELVGRGHEVRIFCGSHEGAGPGETLPRMDSFVHEGLQVHRVHRTGLYVDNWEKGLAPEVTPLLEEVLADFSPDIVHVHHWIRLTRNLIEICHDRGIPAVCTLHDLWTTCAQAFRVHDLHFFDPGEEGAPCPLCGPPGESMTPEEVERERELFRDDFANELKLARRIIVPSNAHKKLLRRCHPGIEGRMRVVPHGTIAPFVQRPFRPDREPGRFSEAPLRIGHWGHLSRLKGIDVLLDALHSLKDPQRVHLELLGEVVYPEEKPLIEERLRGLSVTRHGVFEPLDLLEVPMDLAVIPTRCSESFSFVLDEAFALGLPAIVSARGALPERLCGAGTSFESENPASLARAIEKVLEQPRLLHEWGRKIPRLRSVARNAEALERVYEEVVISRAPLPRTPEELRTRRLHLRCLAVENRNRLREEDAGVIRNMKKDLQRASKTLEEMDGYHREKDQVIATLQREKERLEEEVRAGRMEAERLREIVNRRDAMIRTMGTTVSQLTDHIDRSERRRRTTSIESRALQTREHGGRLKILMVIHQFVPKHVAGTEVYTFNLARELSRKHEVLILTAESDHSRERFEESRFTYEGLPVWQVIHNYKWNDFVETYDCPEADTIFRRVLREMRPDVVHIQHLHYWSANFVTIAAQKGIPVVYHLHDYSLLCPRDGQMLREDLELCREPVPEKCAECIAHMELGDRQPPAIPRGLHPGAEALLPAEALRAIRRGHALVENGRAHQHAIIDRLDYLKRIVRDVDLFISPSEFLKQIFVDTGFIPEERIIVSDNGMRLSAFHRHPPRRFPMARLRVGYVGTIARHKGLDVLVDAMNLIADERITCRIWGEVRAFEEYTESLRQRIRNPRTLLMGPFRNDCIEDVLDTLDVLVIPSLWYENSPITIHEAALAGLPVIVSDLGGMAEHVQPDITGLKFPPGDAEALARSILSCLSDPCPLAHFDPSALPQKSIQEDAADMERRYAKLLNR